MRVLHEFLSKPRQFTRLGIVWAVILTILGGILLDIQIAEAYKHVEVQEITAPAKKEVRIEVVYNWTPERVKKEIRTVFPEQPELAIAVFKCESGLVPTAKGPTQDYGIAQVHSPSWDREAKRLGYTNYRTDVKENLAMARHIYDTAGESFSPWVCFTKKMY